MSLKKTIVSGAAALAIMGTAASAVQFATDGTGDYLISPVYYAVSNWKTDLKVVNTNTTKAVVAKVVVRGGKNSEELVDFAIYLTPGDVWDGKIYQDSDGNVYLESHDDSLMFGQKQEIITVKDENASNDCTDHNLTLIAPVVQGKFPTSDGRVNLTERAADKGDEARRGYVEVLGLAQYDPQDIISEINASVFSWSEGCEFNKTLFYTGARKVGNAQDLNETNAHDVSGADLTGEQTISATAADDKDKRFMKLPMLAIEDLATVAKTVGVLGPDTSAITNTYSSTSETDYRNLFNKKHVYVLYEGNNDQSDIVPTQVIFTYPYKDVDEYNISTADTMFRDKTELAQACSHIPCHTSIHTDLCESGGGSGFSGTNPDEEVSGYTPPPPEGCPVIHVTDEVGIIFDHDPSAGIIDPTIAKYAFTSGGYVDIDLSNVPTLTGADEENKTGLPVIPTTIMAKDIDGLYLNNHLYNPYNK